MPDFFGSDMVGNKASREIAQCALNQGGIERIIQDNIARYTESFSVERGLLPLSLNID